MPPVYRNQFPASDPGALRLALVGEALGANELAQGRPFCGAAGQALDRQLAKVSLLRSRVFIGNVSQVQPPHNEFDALDWNAPEVQDGITALLANLARFKPNLVLTMGNVPLHLFSIGNVKPPQLRRGAKLVYNWPRKITTWRGSLFESSARCTSALQYGFENNLPQPRQEVEAGATPAPGSPPHAADAALPLPSSGLLGETASLGAVPDSSAPGCVNDFGAQHAERDSVQPRTSHTGPRYKCLATIHPAFCLRAWSEWFNFQADLRRAATEALTPNLNLPEMDFDWGPR